SGQTITDNNLPLKQDLGNIIIDNSNVSGVTLSTAVLATNLTLNDTRVFSTGNNDLTVTENILNDGVFNEGANPINVGKDFNCGFGNGGIFNAGSGTLNFNGGGAPQSFTPNNQSFGIVQTTVSGTAVTMTGSASMTSLDIAANTSFTLNSSAADCILNIAESANPNDLNIQTNGSFYINGGAGGDSVLNMASSSQITNNGLFQVLSNGSGKSVVLKCATANNRFVFTGNDISYNNKIIYLGGVDYRPAVTNLSGAGSTIILNDSYNIFTDITVGSSGKFTDNACAFNITGDWTVDALGIVELTGTAIFSGAAQSLTSGGVDANHLFFNLTHSGGGALQIVGNDIYKKGSLTNSN
ncbi:MAG TPA: hypothetical protein PLO89_12400, partial [Spirochaetota bacterium]|nr:hypothetical protein [Spirochaetota bacterium]